ncbi:MAG: XisI protein [Anabaena sp. CoA2_C59]|nr:XisI protein [Anabaena sp. CoA2_C59]
MEFFVDLGAERLLAAQKQGQQIAVEVKSFSVPKEDIVLGFHAPYKRQFTGFAVG